MNLKMLKLRLHQMSEDGGGGGGDAGGEGDTPSSLGTVDAGAFAESVPEKYRVYEGEGDAKAFNMEQSFQKTVAGYAALSKQLGAGENGLEMPPATPGEYALNAEPFGEKFDMQKEMESPLTQEFMKGAHELGLNNTQVQFVMEHAINKMVPSLSEGKHALSFEQSESALLERFENPQAVNAAKASANRAMKSIAGTDDAFQKLEQKYGNDPEFIAFAAQIGKEMREDDPANLEEITGGEDIDDLLKSEAYLDKRHKDHDKAAAKVHEYYQAAYSNQAVN